MVLLYSRSLILQVCGFFSQFKLLTTRLILDMCTHFDYNQMFQTHPCISQACLENASKTSWGALQTIRQGNKQVSRERCLLYSRPSILRPRALCFTTKHIYGVSKTCFLLGHIFFLSSQDDSPFKEKQQKTRGEKWNLTGKPSAGFLFPAPISQALPLVTLYNRPYQKRRVREVLHD